MLTMHISAVSSWLLDAGANALTCFGMPDQTLIGGMDARACKYHVNSCVQRSG